MRSLAFSPDGSALAAALPKAVVVFATATRQRLRTIPNPTGKSLLYAGFRASSGSIVAVAENGQVFEWDGNRFSLLREFRDSERIATAAALSESGSLLVLATEYNALAKGNPFRQSHPADFYREYRIKIYDLTKGSLVKQIDGIDGRIVSLSLSPDNRYVAAHRIKVLNGVIGVYDLQRGVEAATVADAPAAAGNAGISAVFSPD